MQVDTVIAEILRREGVELLIGYPVNPVIEAVSEADIRAIIVCQECAELHMADAFNRLNSGRRVGVFPCSLAPGRERR